VAVALAVALAAVAFPAVVLVGAGNIVSVKPMAKNA
jgi:hypothetical protein